MEQDTLEKIDEIWNEMKGMTKAIQVLTNVLVTMQTGLEKDIYPEPGINSEPDPKALKEFKKKVIEKKNRQNNELVEALSQIFIGKSYDKIKGSNDNFSDILSRIITGRNYNDLELGKKGGETREYDSTLNGRLHKMTEMITGILTGLFTEDEIKEKLEKLDIQDQKSMEKILGSMNEKTSLLKSNIHAQERITRAIQALVLSFIHNDVKSALKMAEMRQEPFPEGISQQFLKDLKEAYSKIAGDFTHNIKNRDKYKDDDHPYGEINLTDI